MRTWAKWVRKEPLRKRRTQFLADKLNYRVLDVELTSEISLEMFNWFWKKIENELRWDYIVSLIKHILTLNRRWNYKIVKSTFYKWTLRLISVQCNLASARNFAIAFFWNACNHERYLMKFVLHDNTHFKRERSQNSARSLNCTEWKSFISMSVF